MAKKKSGRRGSAIIALIAVLAALGGGASAASADPGNSQAAHQANAPGEAYYGPGLEASWNE
jgi:hypothetical protein